MGFLNSVREFLFGTVEEVRADDLTRKEITTKGQLLTALVDDTVITKERALQIPTVKAALNLIKGTVRETPLKLYERGEDGQITEVKGDIRTRLLNDDTGDTLSATQMWDALIEDYFLLGGGYAYINKRGSSVKSLHYVENEEVAVIHNNEAIFKDYDILVRAKRYFPFQFLKILRDTKNGAEGTGLIKENSLILQVAYNALKFENNLVATGGNKKGFIKSTKKLAQEAIDALKKAWRNLYSSSSENIVVLNEGLEFQESSNTSVEMQLNENKKVNKEEIAEIFNIPLGMLAGTGVSAASEDDKKKFADFCVIPFLEVIKNAVNRDLLLEEEKERLFFDFDTKEIKKGSILERFQAYEIAVKNNFMFTDDVRRIENLPASGLDFVNLNLGSVLYNTESGKCFVPNTGETVDLSAFFGRKGGMKADES